MGIFSMLRGGHKADCCGGSDSASGHGHGNNATAATANPAAASCHTNPAAASCHTNPATAAASCHAPATATRKKRPDYLLLFSFTGVAVLFVLGFFPATLAAYPPIAIMADTAYHMIHAMWWGVVIGAVFIGILARIPREFIMSILGRGGSFTGLLRATGAGVLLDLCSHGILMVASKLYERGASAGQVIAFLLASPWNSFSLTLVLIGLVGVQWTLAFIVLSMAIALATGWIFDLLVRRRILPANHNAPELPADFDFRREAITRLAATRFDLRFFRETAISAIRDSRMVVRWLLFGILLAAILRAALAPETYGQFFGPTFFGLFITVLVATVLEVCSEGSAPIAADILTRAKAPGNGFAFLMAGVATDYTEVMVLKDTTRSLKLALFLPLVSVPQVLVVAWAINRFAGAG